MGRLKIVMIPIVACVSLFGVDNAQSNPFVEADFSSIDRSEKDFLIKLYVEQKKGIEKARIEAQRKKEEQERIEEARRVKERELQLDQMRQKEAVDAELRRMKEALIEQEREVALNEALDCKSLLAEVSLSTQRMMVYKGGELLYRWKVSTGRNRYKTPRGEFKPTLIKRMHYSKQYKNAPMPYTVFFHNGYAVHGTNAVSRLGKEASHGCVRLRTSHAKKFYHLVRQSGKAFTTIKIVH